MPRVPDGATDAHLRLQVRRHRRDHRGPAVLRRAHAHRGTPPDRRPPRPVKKVFTPVGITFKGNGFYKTDSRGSKNGSSASPSSNGSSKDSTSDSSSSSTLVDVRLVELVDVLGLVELVRLVQGEGGQQLASPARARAPAPAPAATRTDVTAPQRHRRDRGLRRLGVLRVPRRRHRGRCVDTPYGAPSAPVDHRHGGRPSGRLPPPPRRTSTSSSPPPCPTGPTCGRCRSSACAASWRRAPPARSSPTCTRATSWCSTSSSTARGAGPTPTTTARPSTTSPSPIRTTTGSARRCSTPVGPAGITVHDGGHRRRHPGSSLQHPGRVPLVPPDGLARGQHDQLPRGGAGQGGRAPPTARSPSSPTTTPASTARSR